MEKIGKIITIILWALIAVSAILVISLMANISENDLDPAMLSWINVNLIWVYILGILGGSLAVIFGLVHSFSNAQSAKKGILSLGFLVGVVLIAYIVASPAIPKFIGVDKFIADGLNGSTMKLVDTGLITLYIMLGIAILTFIIGPIIRVVRK